MSEKIVILNTKCPICGAPATMEYKPFCSKRCADVDLNRWFTGNYVVHTNETPTEEDLIATMAEQRVVPTDKAETVG